MQTAEFKVHIEAPVERVWDFWSDYEGYAILKGIGKAKLLREGRDEKNGVGAVRKIRILGITFVEEIVAFDRPQRIEYRVRKCTIPMEHEIGIMEFTENGGGTDINWSTTSELKIPKVAFILLPVLGIAFNRAFQGALNQSKVILESDQN